MLLTRKGAAAPSGGRLAGALEGLAPRSMDRRTFLKR